MTDVLDLNAPAIGFRNVDAVFGVDTDRSGVLDLTLVGESIERQSFGNRDLFVELGRDELGAEREKGGERK